MNPILARTAAALTLSAAASFAQPAFLISQGTTVYRYQNGGVQNYTVNVVISGMTTVPAGLTVGAMNGGASGGDIIAIGGDAVYRIDNPLGTPSLTQIGVPGGTNASPVFVGNRLFGVGGQLPQGSVVTEWRLSDFFEINLWSTGIFGGPGGMVNVPGTPDEFYYAEFNNDTIYHYRLGNTFSTPVCPTPNHDYVGFEMVGGVIYASYALPGTNQFVFGTQSLTGAFNQLAVLDTYHTGITGVARIVPAPGTLALLGATGLTLKRRRR